MLYVIWLLCGIAAAIVANAKNRNIGGWLIGGMLFGVFALLIVACLEKLPEEQPSEGE